MFGHEYTVCTIAQWLTDTSASYPKCTKHLQMYWNTTPPTHRQTDRDTWQVHFPWPHSQNNWRDDVATI